MDDPLGLLVQAVAVLAAGMYPVGFLFGTCSDCCCPPCNRCTHYANGCPGYDEETASWVPELDWTFTVDGIGTVSVPNVPLEPADSLSIPEELLPELPAGTEPITSASIRGVIFSTPEELDECGCSICGYEISLRAGFSFVGDGFAFFEKDFTGSLTDCSETEIPMTGEGLWSLNDSEINANEETVIGLLAQLLNGLTVTMSLTAEPCECGACCEACGDGASCADNVAEGSCTGQWLGVDTTCEEDGPCPTGSCCDAATGLCTETYEWNCAGTWTADAVCDPNPCPQPPEGACCDGEGNCTQTIEVNCAGTWTEGVECDPNPCPQLGSCCDPDTGGCTQTLEANCAGTWTEGESCDPNPCPQPTLGACCDGEGGCSQTTQANCPGVWYEGTACDPNPCVLGWCCEYLNGVLSTGFATTEGECEGTDPAVTYVWTEGGEIECPPTNP